MGLWQGKRLLTVRIVRRDLLVMAVVCSSILDISMINEVLLKKVKNVREEVESCTSREGRRWKDLTGRVLSRSVGGVSR